MMFYSVTPPLGKCVLLTLPTTYSVFEKYAEKKPTCICEFGTQYAGAILSVTQFPTKRAGLALIVVSDSDTTCMLSSTRLAALCEPCKTGLP